MMTAENMLAEHTLAGLLQDFCGPAVRVDVKVTGLALDSRKVNAYLFRDYWQDVGTVESFYEANIMLTRPRAPFNFYRLVKAVAVGLLGLQR